MTPDEPEPAPPSGRGHSPSPFEDNVVFEPREAEPAVAGLNEGPLQRLLETFARLEAEPVPRRQPVRAKAQLVTSAEPGYGKSHLVGRLFRALDGRALPVYLRPFEDPRASWRSILHRLVAELHRPGGGALGTFAAGVFGGLLGRLLANGTLTNGDAGFWGERLRAKPLPLLGLAPSDDPADVVFRDWLREREAEVLPACARLLGADHVSLHAPARLWLRALLGAAGDSEIERVTCLDWLRGGELSPEDARALGLPLAAASPGEPDRRAAARNAVAWERLQDWFALAGYAGRPFLLCFDQTELMTRDPRLATEFGAVVESLVQCGLNVLTVVTANAEPWERALRPNIEVALQARFSAPIELEGIDRATAERLARQRLADARANGPEVARFCDPAWLDRFFRDSPRESPRRFLDECARRWRELAGGTAPAAPEPPRVEAWFERARLALAARPALPGFDADTLRWAVGPELVGDTLVAAGNVRPGRVRDLAGIMPMRWRCGEGEDARRIFFGFEAESGWQRWKALLERAERVRQELGARARCVFLRTPEQPPVPGASWATLRPRFEAAAAAGALVVRPLGPGEWVRVLAAYELWAAVVEGAAPFGTEETLCFLRGELAPWWRSLLADGGGG